MHPVEQVLVQAVDTRAPDEYVIVLLKPVGCCVCAVLLQGPAFNEQVASLQSELKLLKAANSQLTEDHKVSQQHHN
jgi:hypothetical protein